MTCSVGPFAEGKFLNGPMFQWKEQRNEKNFCAQIIYIHNSIRTIHAKQNPDDAGCKHRLVS